MQPGAIFEQRYRIIREIGAGGFSRVYLAEHLKIEQLVAIKVLTDPGSNERFLREGKILARLKSPHTVRILDFGETADGHPYMISEFIEGETLEDVHGRGPVPTAEALALVEQTLESLAEAHELGIVHRDVKPANIMRLPDGSVKVLDFGIARLAPTVDPSNLTGSGVVIGTPRYIAPEVLLAPESVTPSADVFALGLVLFALLTGRDANEGLTSREIVARHLSTEPYELPDAPGVSQALRDWGRQATNKLATERFQTAREALTALRAVISASALGEDFPFAPTAPATTLPKARESARLMSDGEGLRELDLDLGPGALPGVQMPAPRPVIPPSHVPARPGSARRQIERPTIGWSAMLLFVVVATATFGAAAIHLDYWDPFEAALEPVEPLPPDPPEIASAHEAAKRAFSEERWLDAIAGFQEVERHPSSRAAQELLAQNYVGRAITKILEEAIDLREMARTREDLEEAAEGPRQLLELYPNNEAIQEVLVSISEQQLQAKPAPKPRRKQPAKTKSTPKPQDALVVEPQELEIELVR